MSRVLVTGGTGLTGSTIALLAARQGRTVRALVRGPAQALAEAGVETVRGDITDPGSLDAAILSLPIDAEDLRTEPLMEESMMLALPADHALAGTLRIRHEDLVDDLENNVRRILDFCGLPFEPACLEFHKTERSVRTASSEQVRRPIFKDGVDQWRHFEPWLGALRSALGDLVPATEECAEVSTM